MYVGGSGPGNYTKIQDAIDNASDGDTVFVYSGIYYETIDINKSIDVFGQDKETTIIEGKLNDNIVNISVDFVNLGGFSIISDWEHEPLFGIYVQANDTIIKDNIIKTDEANIVLYNSSNNAVIHNFILNTNTGVALMLSHYNNVSNNTITNTNLGIELTTSNYNTIALNNLSSNRYYGLYLNTHCNYNAIFQNTISKIGWDGIEVDYSDNNYIGDNNIFSINDTGIRISGDSDNNALYHNNFWDNGVNAYDHGNNIWDNGYPSGGNYWDDYTGTDTNGDGIGDERYNITGGINQDRYPFMKLNGWMPQPPNKPSTPIGESSGKIGVSYSYESSTTDSNGDQIYYLFDWGDGTDSGWIGKYNSGQICKESHIWSTEGSYSVKVKAKDTSGLESPWSDPLPITMPYIYKPPLTVLRVVIPAIPKCIPLITTVTAIGKHEIIGFYRINYYLLLRI